MLREAEVLLSQGQTAKQVSLALKISEQTYCRWRKEYGGMDKTQARRNRIESERATLVQADGDVVGQTPATFRILPKALRVRA